jgi:hypothetical protein
MKTTINKSARANRIAGIPADTHPFSKLSFVKRRWDVRARMHRVTDWLDVPPEGVAVGHITGYRVSNELVTWAKEHPDTSRHAFESVIGAAIAAIAQPSSGNDSKRWAASTVLCSLMDLLTFAASHADHGEYCERNIKSSLETRAWLDERDALERVQFVERMKAARAAKRERRLNG